MSDSISEIISVLALIASIVVPLLIFYYQNKRNNKSLIYEVLYENEFLSNEINNINKVIEGIKKAETIEVNHIEVKLNGENVSSLWIVGILFMNDSKQHIDKTDFYEPISIQVPDDSKIIQAKGVMLHPFEESISLSFQEGIITVPPMLLNSKDFFAVKLILANELATIPLHYMSKNIKICGRIRGIKQFEKKEVAAQYPLFPMFISLGVVVIIFFYEINSKIISVNPPENFDSSSSLLPLAFMASMLLYALMTVLMTYKQRKMINRIDDATKQIF